MKLLFVLCLALFVMTSGCETRQQYMQEREFFIGFSYAKTHLINQLT